LTRRRKSLWTWSRRKRAVAVGIALIAAALLVELDRGLVGPQWARRFSSRGQTTSADLARYDRGAFAVVRVVDGDTVHLDAPDRGGPTTKVRLLGIDAPEMGSSRAERMYFAEEATARARTLALNKVVTVHLDERAGSRDKYDRLLAYLELPDGTFVNEDLLSGGYVYADLRFRHSYYNKYKQLESAARALKHGLWAHITADQFPPWRRERLSENDAE
jgi:endonuclease YncB( thermonuclease family)